MATREILIPSDEWVQITFQGEESGSFYCSDLKGLIALTEAASKPETEVKNTAQSGLISGSSDEKQQSFYGVGSSKFVFARAMNIPTAISVSVAE